MAHKNTNVTVICKYSPKLVPQIILKQTPQNKSKTTIKPNQKKTNKTKQTQNPLEKCRKSSDCSCLRRKIKYNYWITLKTSGEKNEEAKRVLCISMPCIKKKKLLVNYMNKILQLSSNIFKLMVGHALY